MEEAETLSNEIVCEVLSHLCGYLNSYTIPSVNQQLEQYSLSVELLHSKKLDDKELARQMIPLVAKYVPAGTCMEAMAIFKYGVTLDSNSVKCKVAVESVESKSCSSGAIHLDHDYLGHPGSSEHMYSQDEPEEMEFKDTKVHVVSSDISRTGLKKLCKKQLFIQTRKESTKNRPLLRKLQINSPSKPVSPPKVECYTNGTLNSETYTSARKVCIANVKKSDQLIELHTGLPSYKMFRWVYDEVYPATQTLQYWNGSKSDYTKQYQMKGKKKPGPARELTLEDELLMTLMKLKLNLTEDYISFLFDVSSSVVSTIISTWIPLLAHELSGLIYWPTREEIATCYPDCFKKWSNVKAILDCFEIQTEKPSHVEANTKLFSSYKNRPSSKFLLACTPGGTVSFISPPAGGNMSDKEMVVSRPHGIQTPLGDIFLYPEKRNIITDSISGMGASLIDSGYKVENIVRKYLGRVNAVQFCTLVTFGVS